MSHIGPYGFSVDSYPSITLTVTSPPQSFDEPLSVEEMIDYLKVPKAGPTQDELIASLIRAARSDAERLQNRELVQKTWDMTMDSWGCNRLGLATPLISVDLVQYQDADGNITTLAENTDYVVDTSKSPGVLIAKNFYWPSFNPWPAAPILIRFTSGYSTDDPWWSAQGDMVKAGMRLRISDLFYDRNPKLINGIDSAEWAMMSGAVPSVR